MLSVRDDASLSYVDRTCGYQECDQIVIGGHGRDVGISQQRALLKWSDEITITSLAP